MAADFEPIAWSINPGRARELVDALGDGRGRDLALLLGSAFPPLTPVHGWQTESLDRIAAEGWSTRRHASDYAERMGRGTIDLFDPEAERTALRRAVWAEKARIALRELLPLSLGGSDVDVTSRELAELADVSFQVALREAKAFVVARRGAPMRSDGTESRIVVIGMGKLGGLELNAGSDVDVVFFYDTDQGGSSVSLHEHWTEVTRRAVATLDAVTSEGFAWRVDLRLRPEGSAGPVASSLASAERYYETWGRTWERAALLRARPVAGDLDLGRQLTDELFTPFVYRRQVDPSIATALAEMVERSRAELSRDPARDVKLGEGGIREAEFFVQALQLVWGGREPAIRAPGTLVALERLRGRGLVSDREAKTIADAYLLLRRVEHRIQWMTGVQTHLLPDDPQELERLAYSLGYEDSSQLLASLGEARARVRELFRSILPDAPRPPPRYGRLVARIESRDPELTAEVQSLFGDAEIADHLVALTRRPDLPLGSLTRELHPGLADELFDSLSTCADPSQAARALRLFFGRFHSPSAYVAALAENPQSLRRLIGILGASAFVGEALVQRPDLVDVVLFGSGEGRPVDPRREVSEAMGAFERDAAKIDDPHELRDRFVAALRRAKARVTVETAIADLAGGLPTREVTRVLSELADEILQRTVDFEVPHPGLAVIAMGKLGGRDVGYGSDLDVLFVYDPAAAPAGTHPPEYFSKCAQRIIRLVTVPHPAGTGHELDTRLRPSGSKGLLVTSLEAFARYHGLEYEGAPPASEQPTVLSSGAAWERQTLLRARFAAGDRALGEAAIRLAHVAAYERGAPPPGEMHQLRMRMEKELAKEHPGHYDVKVGRGGLLDVEFAVQWLQMSHPNVAGVRTTDTHEALFALNVAGVVATHDFEVFRDGYAFLRKLEQRIRVLHGAGETIVDALRPGLEQLARRMGIRDTTQSSAAEQLLAAYSAVTREVRETYENILGVQ